MRLRDNKYWKQVELFFKTCFQVYAWHVLNKPEYPFPSSGLPAALLPASQAEVVSAEGGLLWLSYGGNHCLQWPLPYQGRKLIKTLLFEDIFKKYLTTKH